MNRNPRSQIIVFSLVLVLLFGFSFATHAKPRGELEPLATSEAVPALVREAAVEALGAKYLNSDMSLEELESIATGDNKILRAAAVPALVNKYEDVSDINTTDEAQEKAKELRKKGVTGETDAIKQAAGEALGSYFTSFHLNGVEGYSTEELEALRFLVSDKVEFSGLQVAVTEALSSIYPNEKKADELRSMIKKSDSEMIMTAAFQALSVLYSSPLAPQMTFKELQKMAGNKELSEGERMAAGMAMGEMAADNMTEEELIKMAKTGETSALRVGAGEALTKVLVKSERTESELLNMAAAATKEDSSEYQQAVVMALADRLAN